MTDEQVDAIELWRRENGTYCAVKLARCAPYIVGGDDCAEEYYDRVIAYAWPLSSARELVRDPTTLLNLPFTQAVGDDLYFARELEIERSIATVIIRLDAGVFDGKLS